MRSLAVAMLIAAPLAASAQQSTADQLQRAKDMYAAFNIEGARPILLNIISPNYLLSVTPAQKVEALKYLGASYAILDKADSAATFFTAALDFDPFTSLDAREFSSAEQSAFNAAKQRIFKVAIRPVAPKVLDTTHAFRLITTHRANLTVTLIDTRDTSRREILYQADNDGLRDIPWQGLLRSGERADSTIYELRAEGRSLNAGAGNVTVDRQLFRIEHVFAPLEDTLRSFADTELLIEEYQPSAPWFDLIKGSALALAAISIPVMALDNDVPWRGHAAVAAGVGAAAGGIAFQFRRQNRKIPANVAENERRRAQRNEFNAVVRARNAQRVAATILLICPATGCPR
ncbi:MAG TPA: hypothetical protein VEB19_19325 [Gemmatimonadaceae bacterium]|nr:hypothetical protein [Gemmatimonadaceae bacterium]